MTGDDNLSDLHRTDPWIAAIGVERIAKALNGFQLPLSEGWDIPRLANAIKDVANAGRGDPPQGNAHARQTLIELAKKASALHLDMRRMGETAEAAVFWEVFRLAESKNSASRIDYDEDFKPMIFDPLERLANILARAASQIATFPPQTPRWAQRYRRDRRIALAVALTDVFQEAYDTPARANNWGAEYGTEHPWPDFFKRIYGELFPDDTKLNLPEVLQEAARELPALKAAMKWLEEQDATRPEKTYE